MLDWYGLTNRQKTVCVCLALLMAAGIAAELAARQLALSAVLESASVALLFASLLLNPVVVSSTFSSFGDYLRQVAVRPIPSSCKKLALAAFVSLLLSRVASLLG